jgi:hypothetical protein
LEKEDAMVQRLAANYSAAQSNRGGPSSGETPRSKQAAVFPGVYRGQPAKGQASLQNVGWLDPAVCSKTNKSPRLTEAQLKEVEAAKEKSTVDGWKALAKYGDRYAAASVEALSQPGMVKRIVMRKAVQLAGGDPDSNEFQKAAKDHLDHYIQDIKSGREAMGGYRLPTSTQIEKSYYDSLKENGISPYANTALLFARTAYPKGSDPKQKQGGDTWHDCANGLGINLEADRKGPPSKEALSLDRDKASAHLLRIEAFTAIRIFDPSMEDD